MSNSALVGDYYVKGLRVEIHIDEDPINWREDGDMFGTLVGFCRDFPADKDTRRYDGASDFLESFASECTDADLSQKDDNELLDIIEEQYTVLPVRYSDYGSSGCNIYEHNDWDRCNGVMLTSLQDAIINWNLPKDSNWATWMPDWDQKTGKKNGKSIRLRSASMRLLKGELEEFGKYLQGDVYGYVITGPDNTGKEIEESCWGFYGMDYVREEAKSIAEHIMQEPLLREIEAAQQRELCQKNHQ